MDKGDGQTRILLIAGTDGSAGAGLFRDQRVALELGVECAFAVTGVTAQTDAGVRDIALLSPQIVSAQIEAAFESGPVDAIKIGMLGNAGIVAAVADALGAVACPVVLDPVLQSTSGAELLDGAGVEVMLRDLLPLVRVVTPNLPEFERLTGSAGRTATAHERAGMLLGAGAGAVLVKGGHGSGPLCIDVLHDRGGATRYPSPRWTRGRRGTGCTLSTAIACFLGQGMDLPSAVERAKDYTARWISAPEAGVGEAAAVAMEGRDKARDKGHDSGSGIGG